MKKYIIFFVVWILCIGGGFFLYFVDRANLGFVTIFNQWIESSCIYSVLIGYIVAFGLVIGLWLKDKLKNMKIEDKQDKDKDSKEKDNKEDQPK